MKIKKLTKQEIIEYYHKLSYPEQYDIDFVPHDMKLKSFEKMLTWMNIRIPEEAKEDKPVKMVFEIVTAKE